MIPLYTANLDIQQLKILVENKMEHRYLKQYFKSPIIDEEKLAILALIINQTDLSEKTKLKLIISTTLVQVAINIHESVPAGTEHEESERDITVRQLSVLSGDYFSGLYYLILSEIEEIEMIRTVASAIKQISEYKMNLYYNEFNSFNEYIKIVQKVESLLIITVSEYFGYSELSKWAEKTIITSKLSKELNHLQTRDSTPILTSWSDFSPNDESFMYEAQSIIKENIKQIEENFSNSRGELALVKTQIRYMLDDFIYNVTSVMEEG